MPTNRIANKEKSLLDGVPVVTTSEFDELMARTKKKQIKGIVGTCPSCGAPIYGPSICSEENKPEIIYSCTCRELSNKELQMHTK